jgi:hypothetical protein
MTTVKNPSQQSVNYEYQPGILRVEENGEPKLFKK